MEDINMNQKLDDYDACINEFCKIYNMSEAEFKGLLGGVNFRIVTL